MSKVTGFSIINARNWELIGVFPLTFPIGETVSRFEEFFNEVRWEWAEWTEVAQ
jgi:hypothetical protein